MNEKKYIYLLKAFAIFSVVCAHSALVPENFDNINMITSKFLTAIGTMGVPLFFVISGYLFWGNKKGTLEFWKRKVFSIAIPWIFCETIIWLYVVLRKGGISFFAWAKFIFGVHHSTYYLTILIIFFFIYWKLKEYEWVLVLSAVLSSLSILATAFGWKMALINEWTFTIYLNPVNWMIYFVVGIFIAKRHLMEVIAKAACERWMIMAVALLFSFTFHIKFSVQWLYFSKFALINLSLQIMVVMGVSYRLLSVNTVLLEKLGKYSFTIYLLHELFVGVIVYVTSKVDCFLLTLSRPFIIIALIMIGIKILRYINDKYKNKLKFLPILIGLRL